MHRLVDDRGDRLHLRQHLEPRLGLRRFCCAGAEAVDESLQMGAPLLLLLGGLALKGLLFPTLALEARIAAAPKRELGPVEMQDVVGDVVQKVAVVADHQDRRGAVPEIIGEPQDALEIEVVGRLVEKQDIRLREKHRGERHPHPPSSGEFAASARF